MKISKDGKVSFDGAYDIPITPQSVTTTEHNKTGDWRNTEPFYRDITPPCCGDCLAGEDVVGWLSLVSQNKFDDALQLIREANPFPAICGRVCPHPCESDCTRIELGGSVKIHLVERFLGDYGIRTGARYTADSHKKQKIAIIGSGPGGLSSAFYLAIGGYNVTVFEALDRVGGLLRTGIPPFRLPRDVLDNELKAFGNLPVKFELGKRLGTNLSLKELGTFDATFIALGKYATRKLGIENEDDPNVYDGIELLQNIYKGRQLSVGRTVIVIGGGSTAFDCARCLLRLGSKPIIVYRRSRQEMPAFEHDLEEATEEGIEIIYQAAPTRIILKGRKVVGAEFVKMELGEPDSSGRRTPKPIKNSEFTVDADAVVKATGEMLDTTTLGGTLELNNNIIAVDTSYETSVDGIFAGGDCTGAGTVSKAIQHGRLAAAAIDRYLNNSTKIKTSTLSERGARSDRFTHNALNKWYFKNIPAGYTQKASATDRIRFFNEVNSGFAMDEAIREARRCMSCGTCTGCDNCLIFCPDKAIKRNGTARYEVDYSYCKGCGVCVQECPRSAIAMRATGLATE